MKIGIKEDEWYPCFSFTSVNSCQSVGTIDIPNERAKTINKHLDLFFKDQEYINSCLRKKEK